MTDTNNLQNHSPAAAHQHNNNPLVYSFVEECKQRNIAPLTGIFDALVTASSTGILDVHDQMLGVNAINALCAALSSCFSAASTNSSENDIPALTSISLRNCYAGDEGVTALLRYVVKEVANSLEVLELPGNSIQEASGDLATAIAVLSRLKKLVLDWNKIGGASFSTAHTTAASRAASLSSSSAAAAADAADGGEVHNNNSVSVGNNVHRLLHTIASHKTLEEVSLQNNLLGRPAVEDICKLLSTPTSSITSLDISWNSIGESGGARIANALGRATQQQQQRQQQHALARLEYQGNNFARRDCEAIDKALRVVRETEARVKAQEEQEQQLQFRIDDLTRQAQREKQSAAESGAKLSAAEMLLRESKEDVNKLKHDNKELEQQLREAQSALHRERAEFQSRLEDERSRCNDAVEKSSKRLREALEAADAAESKARVHRTEVDDELAAGRDRILAAERESSSAASQAAAAKSAMERIQAEHNVVARHLTETKQRVADLEMQLRVRDDEVERLRQNDSSHNVDLEAARTQTRQAQETCENQKVRIRELEQSLDTAERRARRVPELEDEVATLTRDNKQSEHEKQQLESRMEHNAEQWATARKALEQNANDAHRNSEQMRDRMNALETELQDALSKLSLLEISATRATAAEERSKLLQKELSDLVNSHNGKMQELATSYETRLAEKELEAEERAREARLLGEECALMRAKNEALAAKMKASQQDLEKRVVKSLRTAMLEVKEGKNATHAAASESD